MRLHLAMTEAQRTAEKRYARRTVTFALPAALFDWIAREAETKDMSMSAVIREALRRMKKSKDAQTERQS